MQRHILHVVRTAAIGLLPLIILLADAARAASCSPEGAVQACDGPNGPCAGSTMQCVGGQWTSCSSPVETCNGMDDDCDGQFDEGGVCRSDSLSCQCQPFTCAQLGTNCGPLSDGCGGTLNCGTCPEGQACGVGGIPNVCGYNDGCSPLTRANACAGRNCGTVSDGCRGTYSCGT
jgi:hypothetical protein